MKFEELFCQIDPKQFHLLKFILEGYDGLATLSSYDIKKGLIVLRFSSENRIDVIGILISLAKRLTPYPYNL